MKNNILKEIDNIFSDQFFKNNLEYKKIQANFIEKIIKKYLNKKNIRLLDIACGDAFLLKLLKNKFEVFGLEPNYDKKLSKFNKKDIKIYDNDIFSFKTDEKFHMITCFDFIDHMKNRKTSMLKALKIMKGCLMKDGVIVFDMPMAKELWMNSTLNTEIFEKSKFKYVRVYSRNIIEKDFYYSNIRMFFNKNKVDLKYDIGKIGDDLVSANEIIKILKKWGFEVLVYDNSFIEKWKNTSKKPPVFVCIKK